MILLLDPAWFVRDPSEGEDALVRDLDALVRVLDALGGTLADIDDYWPSMWRDLIVPLQARFHSPRVSQPLAEIRKRARRISPPPLTRPGRVWGVRPLFGAWTPLNPIWEDRMGRALLRLALHGQPAALLARPVVNRNVLRHVTGHVTLDETTRWRLYAQPGLPRVAAFPCLRSARQHRIPWTTRFDPRLPATEDGARYPFCPPALWWKRDTVAVRTVRSKPSFVDAAGNGWTRPNIPGGRGYHWDVFIETPAGEQSIGLDEINVVEYGARAAEGTPGAIHHVPADKSGRIKDVGWSCT